MSITPMPDANFTPQLAGYSGQGQFRFWCQKVLPIVYDDSLSYYELLNKVVNYLNHVIEDVASEEKNIEALLNAYNQLQAYVNNYFSELDVQEEINKKLDEMAESGALLDVIMDTVIGTTNEYLGENLSDTVESLLPEVVETQIGDVVAEQLPEQVSDKVPPYVSEWLDDNVEPTGSMTMIDASLTIAGAGADAKAAGDGIRFNKNIVEELSIENTVNPDTYKGYKYINSNNVWATASWINSSAIIPISGKWIRIVANANSYTEFTILRDTTQVDGESPHYANGYNSVVTIDASNKMDVSVPQNGNYLYVRMVESSRDTRTPDLIQFNVYTDKTLTQVNKAADAKATGDKINEEKQSLLDGIDESYNEVQRGIKNIVNANDEIEMPMNDKGLYYGVVNGGKIYTGNHNISKIIGFSDGVYECNGVTITINGSVITCQGTSTAGAYFCLDECIRMNRAEIGAVQTRIPNGQYTVWVKTIGSYTRVPSFVIVNHGSGSGNLIALQATNRGVTANIEITDGSIGGCGVYLPNGNEFSGSFNICLVPNYDASVMYADINSVLYVYEKDNAIRTLDYTFSEGNAKLYKSDMSDIENICYVKYDDQPDINYVDEEINIFVPAGDGGYIKYILAHSVNEDNECNVWRLYLIVKTDESFNEEYRITTFGETEMALSESEYGSGVFVGGFAHGYEENKDGYFNIFVDGKRVSNLDDLLTITPCNKVEIYNVSNVTSILNSQVFAEHSVCWKFNCDGMYLGQSLLFKQNVIMGVSYMPMICAIRGNESAYPEQVTDFYLDDGNYTLYDVATAGFTGYPTTLKNFVKNAILYGNDKGLEICVKTIRRSSDNVGEGVRLFSGVGYNKLYYAISCYPNLQQNVSAGDRWFADTQINISVK